MSTKHTPAPWRIEWGMAQGGDGHHVCDASDMGPLSIIASVHFHDDAEGETKANAALIAAAPELLELLQHAVAIIKDEYPKTQLAELRVPAMESAIRKATGDQK